MLAPPLPVDLPFHPLAEIFPLIEGVEFQALVEDIRTHGLREPIVLHNAQILDGRNRYRACRAAGVAPQYVTYVGDDLLPYVISLNLTRRHLNESQRAMVAAKLENLEHGGTRSKQDANLHLETPPIPRAAASQLLNVSPRSVANAAAVREGRRCLCRM